MGKTVTYQGASARGDNSGYVVVHDAEGKNAVTLYKDQPSEVSDGIAEVIDAGIDGQKFEVGESAGDDFDQLKGSALDQAGADAGIEGFSSLSAGDKRQALRDAANQGS